MNAVVEGFVVFSGRTSGTVIQRYASTAKPAAATTPSALRRYVMTVPRKGCLERSAQQDDQPRRGAGAHQADAPDPAGQRTETGADLDVEIFEQLLADGSLVDAFGNTHRIERPQPIAFARQERQAESVQRLDQHVMIPFM